MTSRWARAGVLPAILLLIPIAVAALTSGRVLVMPFDTLKRSAGVLGSVRPLRSC